MSNSLGQYTVVVPAAGVGKRMLSSCPKQYLTIENKTILEHTVQRLLSHEAIAHIIIALGENDEYVLILQYIQPGILHYRVIQSE